MMPVTVVHVADVLLVQYRRVSTFRRLAVSGEASQLAPGVLPRRAHLPPSMGKLLTAGAVVTPPTVFPHEDVPRLTKTHLVCSFVHPDTVSLLLEPYRPPGGLSESLFLELLTLVAGYLAKRLEIALKRRLFTQLGGLQVGGVLGGGVGGSLDGWSWCCGCYGIDRGSGKIAAGGKSSSFVFLFAAPPPRRASREYNITQWRSKGWTMISDKYVGRS